jgi:hypothetical protein
LLHLSFFAKVLAQKSEIRGPQEYKLKIRLNKSDIGQAHSLHGTENLIDETAIAQENST